MTERVLPRPDATGTDNAGDNLAHLFCHTCHGLVRNGQRVTVPVTSLCGAFHAVPRVGVSRRLPMCVVCADIANTGRCPHGHPMRHLEEMFRDQPR